MTGFVDSVKFFATFMPRTLNSSQFLFKSFLSFSKTSRTSSESLLLFFFKCLYFFSNSGMFSLILSNPLINNLRDFFTSSDNFLKPSSDISPSWFFAATKSNSSNDLSRLLTASNTDFDKSLVESATKVFEASIALLETCFAFSVTFSSIGSIFSVYRSCNILNTFWIVLAFQFNANEHMSFDRVYCKEVSFTRLPPLYLCRVNFKIWSSWTSKTSLAIIVGDNTILMLRDWFSTYTLNPIEFLL